MPDEDMDLTSNPGENAPANAGGGRSDDPEEYYKAGLFLLKRERHKEALNAFRKAFELNNGDPRFMSYYGLCLSKAGAKPKEGLLLCERAAAKEFYRSELFYNLSQAYLRVGNRRKAYESLRKGMSLDRTNKDIVGELEKMGIRKPPVFPFLERSNAINKLAGKILYRLRLRR